MNENDMMKKTPVDLPRKDPFRRTAFSVLSVQLGTVITLLAVLICEVIDEIHGTAIVEGELFNSIVSYFPIYCIGFPFALMLMRKLPASEPERSEMASGGFLRMLLVCFPIMYAGNIFGNFFSSLLTGGNAVNPVETAVEQLDLVTIIFLVFIGPMMEELLFRKAILDRCAKYGEKTAILFSAVLFGLFHMNFYQMFYAFGLGLIFGYVYVRTGNVFYTAAMHMFINLFGGVISPAAVSGLDEELLEQISSGMMSEAEIAEALPSLLPSLLYAFLLIGICIAGIVIFINNRRSIFFYPASEELPEKGRCKKVYLNSGFLVFALICIAVSVYTLYSYLLM